MVALLAFPPAMYKDSFFCISSPTPVVDGVFDDGYFTRFLALFDFSLFVFDDPLVIKQCVVQSLCI
jgi:hypothetical protein